MVRVEALKLEIPGLNPGSFFSHAIFFSFLRMRFFYFCAISTQASTQKTKLRKICKPYSKRNIDAQSAHVVVLRRYCAK